ncbi:MAG: sugar transferase [Microbacteriaceae bacterium]|nr:sugar transferase [Microbacteriaceae bacterium]
MALSVFGVQWFWLGGRAAELVLAPNPNEDAPLTMPYWAVSLALVLVWLLALQLSGSTDEHFTGAGPREYARVARASAVTLATAVFAAYLLRTEIARGYLLIAVPVGTLGLLVGRWLWRQWLVRERRHGRALTRVVLLGTLSSTLEIAGDLGRAHTHGFDVVGIILAHTTDDPQPDRVELLGREVPVFADRMRVVDRMRALDASMVIVSGQQVHDPDWLRKIGWNLDPDAHRLVLAPGMLDISQQRLALRLVAGLPLLHIETPSISRSGRILKRAGDALTAGAGLVLLSPLLLVIGLLVRATDGGPALYRQQRVGRDGRDFTMLKFRSMFVDADERLAALRAARAAHADAGNEVLFKMRDDPRVTPIGKHLRRYSLDELPQLVNVLRGEMSLVGPRPPLRREVAEYAELLHRKFFVKPGITGLWQVSGRSDLSWEESMRIDLYYVENWSLLLDASILLRTVRAVLTGRGAY